jgi:hypothetical protein
MVIPHCREQYGQWVSVTVIPSMVRADHCTRVSLRLPMKSTTSPRHDAVVSGLLRGDDGHVITPTHRVRMLMIDRLAPAEEYPCD